VKEQISGWTLFTLRGVAVRLHISLLLLLVYVVFVATIQFPLVVQLSRVNPGEITGSALSWAVVFSLALVVSILVHEFGHVFMAQAKGHKVTSVTLMMLGGASHIEEIKEDPATEFKVAIIGPLVSLAIGGLLFWIRSFSISANIDFFCYWVGQTNLVLGIFNLLPAFPMDGGRVLRSFLATRQGYLRGTRTAVKVSQGFSWALGLIGFLQLNFLLMLIAFFIYAAARSEYFILLSRTLLKGMKVKDIMVSLPAISENATLWVAATLMTNSKNLLLPVTRETGPPFLVTADLLKRIPKEKWSSTRLKEIKLEPSPVVRPEDSLDEVVLLTMKFAVGGAPVVQDGQLAGVIRTADISEAIALRQLTAEPLSPTPWSPRTRPAHLHL
jgi:Zn-dependent protease